MLWNLIFEFYIKYIFGGSYGGVTYYALLGSFYLNGETIVDPSTSDVLVFQFDGLQGQNFQFTFGNYLSLIATIITMIIILIVIGHFIKKAFNLFGRII